MNSKGFFSSTVGADFRNSICDQCGIQMSPETYTINGKEKIRYRCGKCGGLVGQLIARSVAIQEPHPPDCFRFSCLWRFYLKVVLSWLLSNYHCKRVVYAQKKRHKNIPIKYRTGEDSPENIKRAILEIIKLELRR